MTVSVMFGTLHFGLLVTLGRRPIVDTIPGTEDGVHFRQMGLSFRDGRVQCQMFCCVEHPVPARLNA